MISAGEQIATGYNRDGSQVPPIDLSREGAPGFIPVLTTFCCLDCSIFITEVNRGKMLSFTKNCLPNCIRSGEIFPAAIMLTDRGVFKTDDCTTLLSNGAMSGCASSLVVIPDDESGDCLLK